ncbi:hypothetical protein HWV62_5091 [Athelia sp. TMB]|nr:hypothetical protein HWV62_5091 [Athelia sp. TMB]
MHVPKKLQSDEGIRSIFESVQVPYPTTSVHINRRVENLPHMIEKHNDVVRELEHILVRYLRGGKIAKERPTIRLGGFWGMGGKKVDAIDFYTARLKRSEIKIENYRDQIDARKAENYGFASMASVPYAHIVGNLLRGKHPKGTTITLAPNPKDIIWENMDKTSGELMRKRFIGFIYLSLIAFFNTVPLFIISVLANLSSLQGAVPFIESWAENSPETFAIVSGVLPPAVSGFFGFFLPKIVRWLSQYQGDLTQSKLDRSVVGRYYSFLVISQLIVFTLIGVIFNTVRNLIIEADNKESLSYIWKHNLGRLAGTIGATYIDQASYWLTYFPLRGFLVFFDLAQILNVVWTSLKKRLFGRTPRDIREWTKPADFEYAIYYTNILFMGTVAMVFAPLAPIVALAAAVVFWISSWVYKYQLMFVFTSKVESGGRLWNVMVNRLLVSVILMQLLFILTIWLQGPGGIFFWVSSIPPVVIILLFKLFLNQKFDRAFRYYIPTMQELQHVTTHSERADAKGNRLEKRFGHPALHMELFTPMLHANMMPLLREIYKGRVETDQTLLKEYGNQKVQAQVADGIKFAAVDQRDLEYDLQLYQRDRGELDWDARSIASTDILGSDNASLHPSKSAYYANGRSSPAPGVPALPTGYNQYLAQGPGHHSNQSDIEMSRIGPSSDHLPLLPAQQGYFDNTPPPPIGSPYQQQRGSPGGSPRSQYPPAPAMYRGESDGYREAPIHRPYPHSRQMSNFSSQGGHTTPAHSRDHSRYSQVPEQPSNMAGRGVYRG